MGQKASWSFWVAWNSSHFIMTLSYITPLSFQSLLLPLLT